MISLKRLYKLSSNKRQELNTVIKTLKHPWKSKQNAVMDYKKELIDFMMQQTDKRCCYCGNDLYVTSGPQLDHFIPLSQDSSFVFNPVNLILSCSCCNTLLKKQYKPVSAVKKHYAKNKFEIFHPYLHKASDHFRFGRTQIKVDGVTQIGKESIRLFKLKDFERIKWRYITINQKQALSKLKSKSKMTFEVIIGFKR